MGVTRVYANKSATIYKNAPNDNFSTDNFLVAGPQVSGEYPTNVAFIKFDTSSIQTKKLLSASYGIYIMFAYIYYPDTITLMQMANDWEEGTITFNNGKPELDRSASYKSTIPLTADTLNQWKTSSSSTIYEKLNYGVCVYGLTHGAYFSSTRSSNIPYADITWEDVLPYPSNISPSGGVVNDAVDNTFSWTFAYDQNAIIGTLSQQAAQVQFNISGTTTTYDIAGATNSKTILANTLPSSGTFTWRVRVQSSESIWSDWSAWYTISTTDTVQRTCAKLSPSGYIDSSTINSFSWISTSTIGTSQTGFDIQTSEDNATWVDLIHQTTINESYSVPANTFTGDIKYWRVRSYNSDGLAGVWSSATPIYVITAPAIPTIIYATATNQPTIKWAGAGQEGYQVQIIQEDNLIYDTEMIAGYDTTLKIWQPISNGTYMARVRIQNQYDLKSEWATYNLTIATTPATTIALTGVSGSVSNILTWIVETAGEYNYRIMRDGYFIAETANMYYSDYTACGEHDYVIRIVQDDIISDSNETTLTCSPGSILLAPAETPMNYIECKLSSSERQKQYSASSNIIQVFVSGRDEPISIIPDFIGFSISVDFVERATDNFAFYKLWMQKIPFIYRDQYEQKHYVIIDSLNCVPTPKYNYYTFTVKETAYEERVEDYFDGYSLLVAAYEPFYVRDE